MNVDPWQSGDWRKQIAATLETYTRNVIRSEQSSGYDAPDLDTYVESIITDARKALTTRPEPAADAVERAAKAIHEFRYQSGDEPRSWEGILKAETKYHVDHGSQWYRQLAGAALQAADYDKGLSDGYVAGLESARKHIAVMKHPLDRYTISQEIGKEIRSYKRDVEAGVEPKPAADTIERAAKAMFTLEKNASGALVQWDDLLDNYGRNGVAGKAVYRDLARAALQSTDVEIEAQQRAKFLDELSQVDWSNPPDGWALVDRDLLRELRAVLEGALLYTTPSNSDTAKTVDRSFGSEHHTSLVDAIWKGLESSQNSHFSNSGIAHRIAQYVEVWMRKKGYTRYGR